MDVQNKVNQTNEIQSVQTPPAERLIDGRKIIKKTVGQNPLRYQVVSITVSAGTSSGTGTCIANSIVIGIVPTNNQDKFILSVPVVGTTVAVNLASNAISDNRFNIILLNP